MSVKGTKVTTGINSATNDAFAQPNFDEPYELFTIDGMKLDSNNSNYRGIVILKTRQQKLGKFIRDNLLISP